MRKRLPIILLAVILVASAIFFTLGHDNPVLASTYIGNAHTYKFHYAHCRYVRQMNEDNKVYFESRDEAVDAGYVPCKVCRP